MIRSTPGVAEAEPVLKNTVELAGREAVVIAANSSLTTPIAVLGFLIVAMSMVGLANAITTNVLERTREIGILRSIGARARDIRRIFTTEGVALAVAGWLIGIPLGYALTRLMVWRCGSSWMCACRSSSRP